MNKTGVPVCSCRWVHVGCAVAMPEVFFQNVNHREGINTNAISPARRKLVSNKPTLFLSFVPAIFMTYTLFFLYTEVFLLSIKFGSQRKGQWRMRAVLRRKVRGFFPRDLLCFGGVRPGTK